MVSDSESESSKPGVARRACAVKKKVGAQKFTQTTKAYQKLKKLFEAKAIVATDKPSDVRLKDVLFQDFTSQQF